MTVPSLRKARSLFPESAFKVSKYDIGAASLLRLIDEVLISALEISEKQMS